MRRGASLIALTLVGCGRLGYDLMISEGASSVGGGGAGTAATDGAVNSGGTPASGGSAGSSAGAGGADASIGTGGADASVGTGGQPISGDARAEGSADASGVDSGSYTCTPGARELCDGRDNNCDLVVDEAPACPSKCVGRAWGSHGYMLCDNTSYGWLQAKTECENAGLQLVKIESKEENDFVAGLVFAARNGDAWIGGSDLTTEGDWRWPDGTPFWSGIAGDGGVAVGGTYTNWWAPAEPNNSNGAGDGDGDCLAMSQVQGFWIDEGCNFFNRALCETP